MWSSLVLGFGLGFLVGFELGPMSAWLIRTTLRSGYGAGAAIAAGVGVVDLCYAGIGVTGVATALRSDDLRTVAGLIGAIVIGYLGVTALLAARQPAPEVVQPDLLRPRRAFVLSLGATAINRPRSDPGRQCSPASVPKAATWRPWSWASVSAVSAGW